MKKFFPVFVSVILSRLVIGWIVSSRIHPLSEEIEMQKIAFGILEGRINFKYAFYPFFISPLVNIFGPDNSLFFSKVFSVLLSCVLITLSYILTKDILFFMILSFQPMNIYLGSLAKADIIILIFTLLTFFQILRYDGRSGRSIFLASFFASLCIVFKYFFPVHLALILILMVREKFKLNKEVLVSYLMGLFPLGLFLPFIIVDAGSFFETLEEQRNLHTSSVVVFEEKDIFSAIFALLCGMGALTPYSVLFLPLILLSFIFCDDKKKLFLSLFFSTSVFISIYLFSPHLFVHYYYPALIPLFYIITQNKYRKKFFLAYFFILFICLFKVKDIDLSSYWIPDIEKECKGRKSIFFVPATHYFLLETKMIKCFIIDSVIYDIDGEEKMKQNLSSVLGNCKSSCVVFLDASYNKREVSVVEEEIIKRGFRIAKEIDSFNSLELDSFERFFFPVFRKLLFRYIFRIYYYTTDEE